KSRPSTAAASVRLIWPSWLESTSSNGGKGSCAKAMPVSPSASSVKTRFIRYTSRTDVATHLDDELDRAPRRRSPRRSSPSWVQELCHAAHCDTPELRQLQDARKSWHASCS